MKEKLSFFLDENDKSLEEIIDAIGCVENIENLFNIEFAAALEDGVPLFTSDYLNTDKEDEFLEKYDGHVVHQYFRNKETQRIYNLYQEDCRFDVTYNDSYRQTGEKELTNAKIISKKIPTYLRKMK